MAGKIERIVDAHIHLWDLSRVEWYPYMQQQEVDQGVELDTSGWTPFFDQKAYFAVSSKWPVEKFVHVAASAKLAEETMELEAQVPSTGHPDAIIGGIHPTAPAADSIKLLDEQGKASRFRGVRGQGFELPPAEVLSTLQERGLVFDLMALANTLEDYAKVLAGYGDMTIVVEHTGWPRSGTDEEFELWKRGMAAMAAAGTNVHAKLSGLAMPLGSIDPEVYKPWIHYAIETFGVDRCFFGSNFPVDAAHGTYDELYGTFDTLTAHLSDADRTKLFATNAERVYRC